MTTPYSLNEERKLFEAWYERHEELGYWGRTSTGLYAWDTVEAAWQVWQARASIKPEPSVQGVESEIRYELWVDNSLHRNWTNEKFLSVDTDWKSVFPKSVIELRKVTTTREKLNLTMKAPHDQQTLFTE